MKNRIREIIVGRNAKLNLLSVAVIAVLVGLGCFAGSRSSAKPLPSDFQGNWQGADGSVVTIRADNSGDYKKGTYSVENATVQLDDDGKSLQFKFLGVSAKTLSVESMPANGAMTLGGVKYKNAEQTRTNSAATPEPTNKSTDSNSEEIGGTRAITHADASKGEMPEDAELQEMVKKSLLDFNDAVQKGDFEDFHQTISTIWKKQTTPSRFNIIFAEFLEKKIDISAIESETATFDPAPMFEKQSGVKILVVEGSYPTDRPPVKFKLKYLPDGKEWKLFGIEVDTTGKASE